jgi:hypothetical protein
MKKDFKASVLKCWYNAMYPLTAKQCTAWALFQSGLSTVEIAKQLKKSKQYVHQTLKIAETKVTEALLDVARSEGLEIRALNPEEGILLGFQPFLKRNVVVTFTTRNGFRTWYWFDKPEEVKMDEKLLAEARQYLLSEAEERGIHLTTEQKNIHPAKLAHFVFAKLLPDDGPWIR